ncbi:hypothetical protein [Ralstonia solanacearum]|uniref:hypothetical protein n=1 Tax=Ralstonia solanacearum TaxID=305 RepID=UPI003D805946
MPRIQFNGAQEILFQTDSIPIVQTHVRQRRIDLTQIRFNLQRFSGGHFCLMKRFARRVLICTES